MELFDDLGLIMYSIGEAYKNLPFIPNNHAINHIGVKRSKCYNWKTKKHTVQWSNPLTSAEKKRNGVTLVTEKIYWDQKKCLFATKNDYKETTWYFDTSSAKKINRDKVNLCDFSLAFMAAI